MARNPIPYVVTQSGDVENAPSESIPIVLHGGGGGGGGDVDTSNLLKVSSEGPEESPLTGDSLVGAYIVRSGSDPGEEGTPWHTQGVLGSYGDYSYVRYETSEATDNTPKLKNSVSVVSSTAWGQRTSQISLESRAEDSVARIAMYGTAEMESVMEASVEGGTGYQFTSNTILTNETLKFADGYSANDTQVLKHVNGTLQWVTEGE